MYMYNILDLLLNVTARTRPGRDASDVTGFVPHVTVFVADRVTDRVTADTLQ